jgi:prepilin-type N-terminal cleavage/methylation domain-containing protein/prepilin-type processing-associated H-X9-DG protein
MRAKHVAFAFGRFGPPASLSSEVGHSINAVTVMIRQRNGLTRVLRDNRDGFTLIELLVVVSIVAILTSLLLPALNRFKIRTRRTTCLNNLRQINVGLRIYADDSGDKTPHPEGTFTNKVLSVVGYKAFIHDYVGSVGTVGSRTKLFACPADKFFFGDSNVLRTEPLHDQTFVDFSSYGFNGSNLVTNYGRYGVDVSRFGIAGRTIGSIRNPVKTVMVAEAPAFEPFSWHQAKRPLSHENARFNDSRNIVSFVDGHVSYIKIFWTDTSVTNRIRLHAGLINPPPGYEYQWGGD